ncbi:hypothetical protein MHYP_G00220460 [Metynnis hypsauchen]
MRARGSADAGDGQRAVDGRQCQAEAGAFLRVESGLFVRQNGAMTESPDTASDDRSVIQVLSLSLFSQFFLWSESMAFFEDEQYRVKSTLYSYYSALQQCSCPFALVIVPKYCLEAEQSCSFRCLKPCVCLPGRRPVDSHSSQ